MTSVRKIRESIRNDKRDMDRLKRSISSMTKSDIPEELTKGARAAMDRELTTLGNRITKNKKKLKEMADGGN